MRVRFAFLCDYAEQSIGGKIIAMGIGFNNLFVPDLSAPVKPFCLVMNLEAKSSEAGVKKIKIHLMDADGKEIVPPVMGDIQLQPPAVGLRTGAGLVVNYNNLIFPAYGDYNFSVVLDGHEIVSLPLSVMPPPTPHN